MRARTNGWRSTWYAALAAGSVAIGTQARADEGPILLDSEARLASPLPLMPQPNISAAGTSARRVARDPQERPDLQELVPGDSQPEKDLWDKPRGSNQIAPPATGDDPDYFRDGHPASQGHPMLEPRSTMPDGHSQGHAPGARISRRQDIPSSDTTSAQPESLENRGRSRMATEPATDQPKRRLFSGDRFDQLRKSAKAPFTRSKSTTTEADAAQQKSWQSWFRGGGRATDTQNH